MKTKHHQFIDTVDECITNGVKNNILHLSTEDTSIEDGRLFRIGGRDLINFASYSYLGLETDERLKHAGMEAIRKFGTQFGASRAYVSIGLFEELEALLSKIFGGYTIVAPSTTLAHQAAIPVIVRDDDAVILDHQVHASVHSTVLMLHKRGIHSELIRHNRMDHLEDRIKELSKTHNRIWYFADGVYSMYGDYAPVHEIYELMNKYPNFRFYVDDAHGMSWTGKNGSGFVLSQIPLHPQMIMTASLNKAFAGGGGAIITPDQEVHRKIRTCGGPLIFSTPLMPPMLGIDIAAAELHLTPELTTMQDELKARISFCNKMLEKHQLPYISNTESPIFYVGMGLPRVGYNMVRRLKDEGFYASLGLFPAVSINCTGVRFCVNRLQSFDDINNMVAAMAYHFPEVLEEEERTRNDIQRAFKLPLISETLAPKKVLKTEWHLQHETTIHHLHPDMWDRLLGNNGSFNWAGMAFLENTFQNNEDKENNWKFHYFVVRDADNVPVLATFFTIAWCKDDLFSPGSVSEQLEQQRKKDPYHLCSRVLMMGSLLTEGNHLYIDRKNPGWKKAMLFMMRECQKIQEGEQIDTLYLRDFDAEDPEMRDFLLEEGFFRVNLPDTHIIEGAHWKDRDDYLQQLSKKSRKHVRDYMIKYEQYYTIQIVESASEAEIDHWYDLYQKVKRKSYDLNTFDMPKKLFQNMVNNPNWEVITFHLKPAHDPREDKDKKAIAVTFSYKGTSTYTPMLLGIDYYFLYSFKSYRQCLFQAVKQATKYQADRVYLGFTADMEKHKLGAVAVPKAAYLQTNDNFNLKVLGMMPILEETSRAMKSKADEIIGEPAS